MRISDWSSDVCSSDLSAVGTQNGIRLRMSCGDLAPDSIVCHNAKIALGTIVREPQPASLVMFEFCRASYYEDIAHRQFVARHLRGNQIGSASCRARVCQYVEISVVAVSLKHKKQRITSIKHKI